MSERIALIYDLVIVGAGRGGLCAALYANRGMLNAVTIERGAPGGELLNTDLIEDYIGFESIKGWELAQKMAEHAKKFGAEIVTIPSSGSPGTPTAGSMSRPPAATAIAVRR